MPALEKYEGLSFVPDHHQSSVAAFAETVKIVNENKLTKIVFHVI